MDTKYDFGPETDDKIVYVRPIPTDDLPAEIRDQIGAGKMIYSVNSAEGERLALVRDRTLAFVLARQNDLAPVNVH